MDARFTVPGTGIRIGLDPIIGLIPVVGDTATLIVGLAMLIESRRLRLGWGTHLRIVWNLVLDWLVGLVPVADLVLDTIFRAHQRNARLLSERAALRYPT